MQAENEYKKVKCIFESFQATFQVRGVRLLTYFAFYCYIFQPSFYLFSIQNLEKELCFEGGLVEEIAMILGATPLSPRDVYRIQFPRLLYGHSDAKHPYQNSLLQMFR